MIDLLFMFLTLCVFFMFVCFSSDVNGEFIQHLFSESHVARSFLVHPSGTVSMLKFFECRCFAECLPYVLFISASPSACCDCSAIRRIAFGQCVGQVAFCLPSFLPILTTLFSNYDGSCVICKIQILCSCVFEFLC